MKQVTAWKGRDGKLYETADECKKVEARKEFEDWYNTLRDEDQLYSAYAGDNIESEVLLHWIIDNKHTLLDFLQRFTQS